MVFNFISWFILVASNYLRIWGDEWAKESDEKDPHLQVKAFFFSNQVLLSSHRLDIYSLAGAHFFPATCMNSQATFWPQIRTIQNHLWCICKTVFAFLLSFAKSLFSIFQVILWWHEHWSVQKSLLVTFWMWFEASCEETRPAFFKLFTLGGVWSWTPQHTCFFTVYLEGVLTRHLVSVSD